MTRYLNKKLLQGVLWALLWPISVALADNTSSILFVCGGNTGRSPMTESLANDYFHFPASGYPSFSRGLHVNPKEILPEKNAITVMQQWTPSSHISSHRATPISVTDIESASIVIAMTAAQKEALLKLDPAAAPKIFTLSQCANGTNQDIDDMYGHDLAVYQQTAKKIAAYLQLIKKHHFTCQKDSSQPTRLSLNPMKTELGHTA